MSKQYDLYQRAFGAVMIETLLVLPLILLIISLLFFCGNGMMQTQRASVMDRYAAWRAVDETFGPAERGELNQAFFDGRADRIQWSVTRYLPERVTDPLIATATDRHEPAGEYSEELLDDLPSGLAFDFETSHRSTIPLWQKLGGTYHHRHVRFANEWKFYQWRYMTLEEEWDRLGTYIMPNETIRDIYFEQLDKAIQRLVDQDNYLAQQIQGLYLPDRLVVPLYRGPTVWDESR